jgi:uncharacterized repeat protein (TIGR01451 family)
LIFTWVHCVVLALLCALLPVASASAQTGCATGGCVSAGPRLVAVDTTQGPVLNLLLQSLLPGTAVNLSVADWNALAAADVNLNALITRLGANLGVSDTSQVLATDVTLAQLRLAMVQVLQADGRTAAANALNLLPLSVPGITGTFRLGDLLRLDLPPGALATANLDVLDLLTGSVQLYNFRNVLTTPTPITVNTAAIGLTGVANVQLWAQVIEPPVYACGPLGTSFHSAAIRIKLNVDVLQGLNLQAITNALNALGLGLLNLTVTADVLKLQVYADIARAEGTITAVDAVAGTLSFQARPGLVNLYVGTIADSTFFNRSRVLTNADVTPVVINNLDVRFNVGLLGIGLVGVQLPLQVTARAAATGSPGLQNFNVSGPFPQTRTASSGTVSAGTLIVQLLNTLDINIVSQPAPVVTLLGLPITLPALLIPTINAVVDVVEATVGGLATGLLQPVLTSLLGGVVDNLLASLGIRIGTAVFTVEGVGRSCTATLTLAKTLVPANDPGRFNLAISQAGTAVASVNGIGNGGATAPAASTPGLVYALGETAAAGTNLASYTTTWSCTDQNSVALASGTGPTFNFTAPAASATPLDVTCRISNTRSFRADVSVSKSDGQATYTPGGGASYVISVSNAGPDTATAFPISDALPNGARLSAPWTCVASGGASSCPASGGAVGDASVNVTVNVDANGTATITVPVSFSADPAAY